MKILVLVESPGKVDKIKNILNSQNDGNQYVVAATVGHILDLNKNKTLGVDINDKYRPDYIEHPNKTDVINNLKRLSKHCAQVWIASDLDQEGEFIGYSICKVLGLPLTSTPRIVFNEVTKSAILRSIKNPKILDFNLLDAQKTRRITDRLVGFLITRSAKSINEKLTVGRVQTMMVKLIVDRELEMKNFQSSLSFHTNGMFYRLLNDEKNSKKLNENDFLEAKLNKTFKNDENVKSFYDDCKKAKFLISDISERIAKKSPPPPLVTSTLQSLVSRGLGISPKRVLDIAQKLYQLGVISYPRTDCPRLPEEKMDECEKYLKENYESKYYFRRVFKSNDDSAQEAHACIYPTKIEVANLGDSSKNKDKDTTKKNKKNSEDEDEDEDIGFSEYEKKVYRYIWLYTISSQMTPSETKVTKAKISISNRDEFFTSEHSNLVFEGYLKVWGKVAVEEEDENNEENSSNKNSSNKNSVLLSLKTGDELGLDNINSKQKNTQGPAPYTESSLMTQLKRYGIGRPSTRANILADIMSDNKQFVYKGSKPGEKLKIQIITLNGNTNKVLEKTQEIVQNAYHHRLYSTELGRAITEFVDQYFSETFNYNFTRELEKRMESIENGKVDWYKVVDDLYKAFAPKLEQFPRWGSKDVPNPARKEKRLLGTYQDKNVYVYLGKYGPVVQHGELDLNGDRTKYSVKPNYSSIPKEYNLDTITLDEAKILIDFPYNLGKLRDGRNVYLKISKHGLYLDTGSLNRKGKTYQINNDMFDQNKFDENKNYISQIDLLNMRSINDIIEKADKPKNVIREVKDIKIIEGEYGPYFIFNDVLVGIPKFHNVDLLKYEELLDLYRVKLQKGGRKTKFSKKFSGNNTSNETKKKVKINFKKK